jgi:hypothetical protein
MTSSRTLMLVLSNPSPEGEAEYNTWYNTVHLPEMLGTPGVLSARRFRFSEETSRSTSEHRYAALYELEGSPEQAQAVLSSRAAVTPPPAGMDARSVRVTFWEELEPGQ